MSKVKFTKWVELWNEHWKDHSSYRKGLKKTTIRQYIVDRNPNWKIDLIRDGHKESKVDLNVNPVENYPPAMGRENRTETRSPYKKKRKNGRYPKVGQKLDRLLFLLICIRDNEGSAPFDLLVKKFSKQYIVGIPTAQLEVRRLIQSVPDLITLYESKTAKNRNKIYTIKVPAHAN